MAAYVLSLAGTNPPNPKPPQGVNSKGERAPDNGRVQRRPSGRTMAMHASARRGEGARAAHAQPRRDAALARAEALAGRFCRRRRALAWALIAVFTLIPYVRMNGKPLILLDIAQRQFTLFGATFLPTDTMLLMLLLVGIFLGIFLLTAMYGRVWCGWACPQTVYMEFLYRPIERLIEGGRAAQLRSTGRRSRRAAREARRLPRAVACSSPTPSSRTSWA